jgi:methionyl-tRNA formyltransferase
MNPTAQAFETSKTLTDQQKQERYKQRIADRGFKDTASYEARREDAIARGRAEEMATRQGFVGSRDRLQQSIDRDRKVAEYKNFAEGFRPINDALVKMGDLAVKIGGAGTMGEVYKKFAPPGSEFYQKGTIQEKAKKAIGV